jgi:3-dehydroquinate dehydratase-1
MVVEGSTLQTFLKNLKKAQQSADMVELRGDTIKGFKEKDFDAIKKAVKGSAIFTFRHKGEGGNYTGSKDFQGDVLKKAFKTFKYVDVAFGNELVKELSAKEKKKLVLSYHEFDGTSSIKELKSVVTKMRKSKPAIIKIATLVNKEEDVITLSEILKLRKPKEQFIIIGMGDKGKLTRILFPMMGSFIAYAAMDKTNIAPGLMTIKEMQDVYNFITNL